MLSWVEGSVDCMPDDAGYDASRIEVLDRHLGRCLASGKVQGVSYLLARGGKVFARKAAGRLTPQPDSPPMTPDSLKGIASITKTVTATAIMKLVEDGLLWLEQPVKTILPEFDDPMHGEIKLCHLLTHTSGLAADPGYFGEPHPVYRWEMLGGKDWLTQAVLSGPVVCRPGEQWNYCTLGYAVLAEIVSRVCGVHFNDYVQDRIFGVLGMSRSFLEVPEALWPEICYTGEPHPEWFRRVRERAGAPMGGGGVFSTLQDLFVFGQCFLNGGAMDGNRILGRKTVQEMTRNQLTGVPAYHWGKRLKEMRHGLGWGYFADGSTVGPETFSHEGAGWCSLYLDPVEQFVWVYFVAYDKGWDPDLMVSPRAIAFSGIV